MKRDGGGDAKNVRFERLKENPFRTASMQLLKNHLKSYPRATLKKKKKKRIRKERKKRKEKPKQS